MNLDDECVKKELIKMGYSEKAIAEILKWYQTKQTKNKEAKP